MKSNQVQSIMTWSHATDYMAERFKWLGDNAEAQVYEDRIRATMEFSLTFTSRKGARRRLVISVHVYDCIVDGLGTHVLAVCSSFENALAELGLTPPTDA